MIFTKKNEEMKRVIIFVPIFMLFSCNNIVTKTNSSNSCDTSFTKVTTLLSDTDVALKFVNEYSQVGADSYKWIKQSPLLTERLKVAFQNILGDAEKENPIMGLEFDPFFDAQEYPYNGFELVTCDSLGYFTLRGKDWPDFLVVLKIINQDNKYMVDGCGMLNIPEDKRAPR